MQLAMLEEPQEQHICSGSILCSAPSAHDANDGPLTRDRRMRTRPRTLTTVWCVCVCLFVCARVHHVSAVCIIQSTC